MVPLRALLRLALVLPLCGCSAEMPDATRVEDGWAHVGDGRLRWDSRGAGCPLVLIGGGSAMDLRQWDDVREELSADVRVIRYDPRGVGESPAPVTPYDDRDDLAALLDQLEVERAVVAGNSSAGGLALEFASTHPDRVLGVVASAPFVTGWEFDPAMQQRVDRFAVAMQDGPGVFIAVALEDPHFVPAPDRPEARDRARALMTEELDGEPFDPALAATLDPPLIDRLSGIDAKILLLVGQLDHPDLQRRVRFLQSTVPAARSVTIPRAGHTSAMENPRSWVAAVRDFLPEVCPGGSR